MVHHSQSSYNSFHIHSGNFLNNFFQKIGLNVILQPLALGYAVEVLIGSESLFFEVNAVDSNEYAAQCISYQILEGIVRALFPDAKPLFLRHPKNGCLLEKNTSQQGLAYKIRAAHICQHCVDSLLSSRSYSEEAVNLLSSIIDGMETIRKNICQISFRPKNADLRLQVNRHGDISVHMGNQVLPINLGNGWEKAIYFLLLQDSQGMKVSTFGEEEHQEQLIKFYLQTKSWNYKDCHRQIETWKKDNLFADLCSSNLSRIRAKLEKQLGKYPHLLEQLNINRGKGVKKIAIDRSLVDFSLPEYGAVLHKQIA